MSILYFSSEVGYKTGKLHECSVNAVVKGIKKQVTKFMGEEGPSKFLLLLLFFSFLY